MIAISCWPWRLLRHYVCDHCGAHSVCQTLAARLDIGRYAPLLPFARRRLCLLVLFCHSFCVHEGILLGLGHLAMQIIKLMKISIISVNPRQLHASQSPYWAAYRRKSGYVCHLYLLKGKYHLWIAICWRQLVAAILLVLLCNKYQWRFIMDKVLGWQKKSLTTNTVIGGVKKQWVTCWTQTALWYLPK